MFLRKSQILALICLALVGVYSCGTQNNNQENTLSNVTDSSATKDTSGNVVFYSMPAPMQVASALVDLKGKFNEKLLCPLPAKGVSESSTNQAFRLGMYAVDLGYTTLFEHNQLSIRYFAESMKLAQDLNVEGAIERSAVDRFKANANNKDSLTIIILSTFNDVRQKFSNDGREVVGFEMLAGSFIEGAYITSGLYNATKDKAVGNLLSEQKLALENLMALMEGYDLGDDATEIRNAFIELEKAYAAIEIITENDAKMEGKSSIKEIKSTDQQLSEINQRITKLRQVIIG